MNYIPRVEFDVTTGNIPAELGLKEIIPKCTLFAFQWYKVNIKIRD